jgi:TonB family protein
MGKVLCTVGSLMLTASWAVAQTPATAPANEPRAVGTVRSPQSIGADLRVPLCPAHFHDSVHGNGIAGPGDTDVTPPKVKTTIPARMTQEAIIGSATAGSGRTGAGSAHLGNYDVIVSVVVDTAGNPHDLCLQKSAGFGLDASATTAVQQYHFDAATRNGRPIKARVPVQVRFVTPSPPPKSMPRTGEPVK